jgi:cobalt-zinc-cadmium efflux system protein
MLKKGRVLAKSFERELVIYRHVLGDPRTPVTAKVFLGLAIGYLCLPFDLIPDFIPVLGYVDDAVVVPALVYAAVRLIPQELVAEHRADVLADRARHKIDMSEHHEHSHAGHSHSPASFNTAFAVGVALNAGYIVFEAIFGFLGHSLALVADAGHNVSDVLGLLLAWCAGAMAKSLPTKRKTYGLRGTSILAALFNAIFLLVSVGAISWEALRRFKNPAEVAAQTVIWVSLLGIAINTITALMFVSGRKGDLNIRGAFLHMAADAAISAGVVIAGLAILFTGRHWIDPTVSLLICAVIVWGTWDLLRESVNLALQGVPKDVDVDAVERYLSALPGIAKVHDLHIWAMSTTEIALTAHLVKPDGQLSDPLIDQIQHELYDRFGIEHMTVQLECGTCERSCQQESESVV